MSGTIETKHIEVRETRGGEPKAFIAGTRISVQNIYVSHELQGMTPDQIQAAYPHLSLAQIHAALTYYFENADEIREQLKREREFAERMKGEQGATRFTRLRDEHLGNTEVNDDSVSSG